MASSVCKSLCNNVNRELNTAIYSILSRSFYETVQKVCYALPEEEDLAEEQEERFQEETEIKKRTKKDEGSLKVST